jgi:hypothetical protein
MPLTSKPPDRSGARKTDCYVLPQALAVDPDLANELTGASGGGRQTALFHEPRWSTVIRSRALLGALVRAERISRSAVTRRRGEQPENGTFPQLGVGAGDSLAARRGVYGGSRCYARCQTPHQARHRPWAPLLYTLYSMPSGLSRGRRDCGQPWKGDAGACGLEHSALHDEGAAAHLHT